MSQKLSLDKTSVWSAKSMELLRKTVDFRGQWGGGTGGCCSYAFACDVVNI